MPRVVTLQHEGGRGRACPVQSVTVEVQGRIPLIFSQAVQWPCDECAGWWGVTHVSRRGNGRS